MSTVHLLIGVVPLGWKMVLNLEAMACIAFHFVRTLCEFLCLSLFVCVFDLFFFIKSCVLKLENIWLLNLIAIHMHFLGISSFSFSCDVCTTLLILDTYALVVICVWTSLVYVLWEKDNVHDVFTLLRTCFVLTLSLNKACFMSLSQLSRWTLLKKLVPKEWSTQCTFLLE